MKKVITIWAIIVGIVVIGVLAYLNRDLLFAPSGINHEQALSSVKNITEVKEYVKLLEDNGKKAHFEIENTEDDNWTVHVFEIVDDGETSHTATFGWYQVSKKTGTVSTDADM